MVGEVTLASEMHDYETELPFLSIHSLWSFSDQYISASYAELLDLPIIHVSSCRQEDVRQMCYGLACECIWRCACILMPRSGRCEQKRKKSAMGRISKYIYKTNLKERSEVPFPGTSPCKFKFYFQGRDSVAVFGKEQTMTPNYPSDVTAINRNSANLLRNAR